MQVMVRWRRGVRRVYRRRLVRVKLLMSARKGRLAGLCESGNRGRTSGRNSAMSRRSSLGRLRSGIEGLRVDIWRLSVWLSNDRGRLHCISGDH